MKRTLILAGILVAGALAAWDLGLTPTGFIPGKESWRIVGRFAGAALSPTLYSQSDLGTYIVPRTLEGALNTVLFATAGMSLALVFGLLLGVLASERWWKLFPATRAVRPALYGATRTLIAFMRSIHEILWGVALLAAFGLNTVSAVIAISIPYAGTLAKVFSEMLDESTDGAAEALHFAGAGSLQMFTFGLLPRALPDMGAYAFYRFECALRSAAILGFFGFPTLGKFIAESVGELYFREAWTYLYALLALILLVEAWSGALRQRLTIA
ncbi:MAG: PhnE/PtxC family ABC transporter permease [Planctomycetota bacterium]|jgi:phosphonate transport system permease protein